MKLLFLSNYFNHHQSALCDALWQQTGGQFRFAGTAAMPDEQQRLGYPQLERPYVLQLKQQRQEVLHWLDTADMVIAGECPQALVRRRLRQGKPVLRFSERPLRDGNPAWKAPLRRARWHRWNPERSPIWLLAAGAYTAGDYEKMGLFRGKSYRWGYFPAFTPGDLPALMDKKDPTQILWVGRFLLLKHPEAALLALRELQELPWHLTYIGRGEQEAMLRGVVQAFGLEDRVTFRGALPADQVRRAMDRAGIVLFSSDREEGWGVVVNEAMSSGCALVACEEAGSVPELLRNEENGLTFAAGDTAAVTAALGRLLKDPALQRRLGSAAYETIRSQWNPEEAARRLLELSETLIRGESAAQLYADGPCSPVRPRL